MPATSYTITKRSPNSSAVKKVCGPEEGHCEKDVKSRWQPRNDRDGRLMAIIMTIQMNLVPNPSEGTKFT